MVLTMVKTPYRNRFKENGYDLDLTYITEKIIVMGNPYNNDSLNDLRSFLSTRHGGRHKIYNLASEEDFNVEVDLNNVESFPFPSNNPCALNVLIKFCSTIDVYLNLKPDNVVVLHCRTGKGRCCLFAACYLLHSGVFTQADDAVSFVCRQRTPIKHNALTVPSQIRYLHYYEHLLKTPQVDTGVYRLVHLRMTTIPAFSASIVNSGCAPYLTVSVLARPESSALSPHGNGFSSNSAQWFPKKIYNQLDHESRRKVRRYSALNDTHADFSLTEHDVLVRGDVIVSLFCNEEKMAQVCFHTAFIHGEHLLFEKSAVDIAAKDTQHYTFDPAFKIEMLLQRVKRPEGGAAINEVSHSELEEQSRDDDGEGEESPRKVSVVQEMLRYGGVAIEESDEDNCAAAADVDML